MSEYDVIIVGNGPAGLSAALYTSRANLRTLVIGKDQGALAKADRIENYFGLAEPISGCELVENTKIQAKNLGADLVTDEIFHISWNQDFTLEGREGSYRAKAVLLATGTSRKKADIEGLSRLEGHGVSYCAICDAFFYRGRKVGVIGSGAYAASEYAVLKNVVEDVTILTNGEAPQFDPALPCDTRKIASLTGSELLQGVLFEGGERAEYDGLFVACGSAGAFELSKKLGLETDGNKIATDEKRATNIPGIYAAGDCVKGMQQIAKAVCDGMIAGTEAHKFLKANA